MVKQACQRPNGPRLHRLLRELPYLELRRARRSVAWFTASVLVAGLLLLAGKPAAAMAATPYGSGVEAAAEHRYAEALASFRQAAELGDRNAMRTLGLMLLYGESLYGPEVARQPVEARRWLQLAAARGCEVSAFMVQRLGHRV
jgi:TPR repeat protein